MSMTKSLSWIVDGAMCNMMNFVQWRRRADACSKEKLASYIGQCSPLSREEFFRIQPALRPSLRRTWIEWDTPRPSGHIQNDRARVRFYAASDPAAPTVFLLHALMSASDVGYRRLAMRFNAAGWNVAFPHLPYHYSRTPAGTWNGELAITADLVRNAEGLRQAVIELRQLMALLRARGTTEFGLIGTSYGGWIGALLSLLEKDFRFIALVQPIVNPEKAVWENPGAAMMRRELRARGHAPGNTQEMEHLLSPMNALPLCGTARTLLTAGIHDRISPLDDLERLWARWEGSQLLRVPQGHFGYRALRETMRELAPHICN